MTELQPNRQLCTSENCKQDANAFCKTCHQFFCVNHSNIHSKFLKKVKIVHQVITTKECHSAGREENFRYCDRHHKSLIHLACTNCYRPLCLMCVDEADSNTAMMRCQSAETSKHETRSVKHVALKIQDELSDVLSEFRVNEMNVEEDMETKRKKYNEQMGNHRKDLDKLKSKVEELHSLLDEQYDQIKQTIIDHMEQEKEMMDEQEAEFTVYQRICQRLHDRASNLSKKSSEFIVQENLSITEELNSLTQFKLEDKEQLAQLSLSITDVPVMFPISLQTTESQTRHVPLPNPVKVPIDFEIKNKLKIKSAYCGRYLHDHRLIHSGSYPITGLGFKPKIKVDDTRVIHSLDQHKSSLYVLQHVNSDERYYIHCINLDNQSVEKSIISFPGPDDYVQRIAVNDKFVVIADFITNTIKVYSMTTRRHLFDIKNKSKFQIPLGLCLLGDTVVVGDRLNKQVVNMTISSTPQFNWVSSVINGPSCIVRDSSSNTILVFDDEYEKIHILSYHGEKLSIIASPSSKGWIRDVSLHDNRFAVTTEYRILVYKIAYKEYPDDDTESEI